MSEIIDVNIADIHVPDDRLRQVKDDVVQLYVWRLKQGNTLQTIEVRRTPNGKLPYTLVSGAHRLEAYKGHGVKTVHAVLFVGDKDQAKEAEIGENLFRNELSALEKVYHVAEYRRLFEARFGKVKAGNPNLSNSDKLAELDVMGNLEAGEESNFFERVKAKLGINRRSTERYCAIAKHLQPLLKDAITGTDIEDNQNAIERLSKMDAQTQIKYAVALNENGGDLDAVEEAFNPKATLSKDERAYENMVDFWTRTNAGTRERFIRDYLPAITAAVLADQAMLKQVQDAVRTATELKGKGHA
jgi:ParB family transcriptional regulator, chromosome partitioning protein